MFQHQLCKVRILLRVFHQSRPLSPCLTLSQQPVQCRSIHSYHKVAVYENCIGQQTLTFCWRSNWQQVSHQNHIHGLMTGSNRYFSRYSIADSHKHGGPQHRQHARHRCDDSTNSSHRQSGWRNVSEDGPRRRHYDKDKLKLDFDGESDLQQLLKDSKKILDNEEFKVFAAKSLDNAEDLADNMEHLVKHLCYCQCSPENILQFLKTNPKILLLKWPLLQKIVLFLEEVGMRRGQLLKALDGHKLLWGSDVAILRKRLAVLRQLGYGNDLRKVVAKWPQILTIPTKQVNPILEEFRKNDFSKDEIKIIIADYPQVLKDSPEDLAMKFHYVHFCMGITDGKDLVHSKFFKYTLDHIRTRHILLDRMGIFHPPDKHKVRSAKNPRLGMMIDSSDSRFCAKVAGIGVEDYEIFKRNLKDELVDMGVIGGSDVEEESVEDDEGSNVDDSEEEYDEYSDSDEEGTSMGYHR